MGETSSFIDRLREQTKALHQRAHTLPYFDALAGKSLPIESYVGQLRAWAIVFGTLERQLAQAVDPGLRELAALTRPKLPCLLDDLDFFAERKVRDIVPAMRAALALAGRITTLAADAPRALVGVLYTLEGSTLGGAMLRPLVERAFDLAGTRGASFFASYGRDQRSRWDGFRGTMSRIVEEAGLADDVIAASNDTFAGLIDVYSALFPFDPAALGHHVAALNPEAGDHAIPTDPVEIEAALVAGRRCWEAFPYFELRYGERGRRFTSSDAAWLVTLASVPEDRLVAQVRWLAGVLATRGMPRILLEVQLELLHAALVLATPDARARYDKLLRGAAALRAERARLLDDTALARLTAAFDAALPTGWAERLQGVGTLLGAEVADEAAGVARAPEGVEAWLLGPGRLPDGCAAAVRECVARARADLGAG